MLCSSHKKCNKKGAEAMFLVFYSDNYTLNASGANAPKKGIALIPFVKNNHSPKVKRSIAPTPSSPIKDHLCLAFHRKL